MARRRLTPEEAAAQATALKVAQKVPERLTACFVEDWVPDDEKVSLHGRSERPDRDQDARMILARSRFREAREKWADQLLARGIDPPRLPPAGRPSRRTPWPSQKPPRATRRKRQEI